MKIPDERRICYLEYRKALRHGLLVRKPCEICGELKTEGHHKDHKRPLEVIWLCRPCHGRVGGTGRSHTEETRKKMSDNSRHIPPPWKGKSLTQEHRERIAAGHRGKKAPYMIERNKNREWTDEMRLRASEAAKKRIRRPQSAETREKIRLGNIAAAMRRKARKAEVA